MVHRLFPDDLEYFSLEVNPKVDYTSSSSGITGFEYVYPKRSPCIKEVYKNKTTTASIFFDESLSTLLAGAEQLASQSANNTSLMTSYLNIVNARQTSPKNTATKIIKRKTPGFVFGASSSLTGLIFDNLFPAYRNVYPTAHLSFTNYSSLNFFNSAGVFPTQSALMYPQVVGVSGGYSTGSYIPSGAFTFDFWIKPRYWAENSSGSYRAGTLMHMSSAFAVSVVTGSARGVDGVPSGYRILLQLSGGANINPSNLSLNALPDLCFVTADNSLRRDTWHHVSLRWGTSEYNLGSGSLLIDQTQSATFVVPSSSIASNNNTVGNILFVGNYCDSSNTGASELGLFFSDLVSAREGLLRLNTNGSVTQPATFRLANPLNAEIQDVKLFSSYLTDAKIYSYSLGGPATTTENNMLFWLPPFFTQASPTRTSVSGSGGVLVTPYIERNGTTTTPLNSDMMFFAGGNQTNLENFTKELVQENNPRLYAFTASVSSGPSTTTADGKLQSFPSFVKGNFLLSPSDNGQWKPNFSVISNYSSTAYLNDLGNYQPEMITLRNLYPVSGLNTKRLPSSSGSIFQGLTGPDPLLTASLANPMGPVPAVVQRLGDTSTINIQFYDVSSLYYGNRILPGSLKLTGPSDASLQPFSFADDGHGNIFRSNFSGSSPVWSSVGNILYNEGIIVLKHPSLQPFGTSNFRMEFKASNTLHTTKYNCYAMPLEVLSSSNPNYLPVSSSLAANEEDQSYVYITNIYLHDDNLNVIARTNIAQPIMKRTSDKQVFIPKIDY